MIVGIIQIKGHKYWSNHVQNIFIVHVFNVFSVATESEKCLVFMNDVTYSFILCLSFHNKTIPTYQAPHQITWLSKKIFSLFPHTSLVSVLGLQSFSLSKNCGALNTLLFYPNIIIPPSQLHLIHTCKHHCITPDVTSNTRLSLCGDLRVLTLFFAFYLFYLIFHIYIYIFSSIMIVLN